MAITNHERVGKALELLKGGLRPFVERELEAHHGKDWMRQVRDILTDTRLGGDKGDSMQDVAALLVIMDRAWSDIFRRILGKAERSLVNELLAIRNDWAHQKPFSGDDAYRALDSTGRLLTAISAPQSEELDKMKMELLRVRFDEQVRTEKRKSAGTAIETLATGTLKPWREVVSPHKDVASGLYQQAEFAADLWQVHLGEGTDEYKHPVEFFRRTYQTESLKRLLVNAVRRICGRSGDPVVQLQTNFGGGKTHSMLALYHLLSGVSPSSLAGIDAVLGEAGESKLPKAKRVVLVGNRISPGNPVTKPDGTLVRTLWGEMAWQLGGKKAFAKLKADDEKATSPGDVLRELFNEYGPCLVLIDEWVAYARMLHDQSDLPAGSFETQFTFAQALTESAKLAKGCLLVISLPASDTSASPHAQADDEEVGGERGRAALARLRNVIARVESSWTPASAEESFGIVRQRLFEQMTEPQQYKDRDVVARGFADMYRTQQGEFPPDCREADYEKRLKDAYPIHPEVFDRLYTDWSTLVRFQRTRGVLRLMAAVIHSLWDKGDKNPLILPCNIPMDDPRVRDELTRYLPDIWKPIIEKDIDGPGALPLAIDREASNLGKYHACRRVARTIYLGSAPISSAPNRGLEDRRVKLGCVMPGEPVAVFGDALRRLTGAATYLYHDGVRYWYSTQATVTKIAEDRADQLKRDPDKVVLELDKRLRADVRSTGEFSRVHPMPPSGQDVPDDLDARLVVLAINHPYAKKSGSAAEVAAKAILEMRGNSPRIHRNTLVFMAVDETRLQDLDEATRRFLAWESILADRESLDLSPHQVKQAETQRNSADSAVTARLPEAYQWLLVPGQKSPQSAVEWQAIRLSGQDSLAARASKKLKGDELLVTGFAATRLRMELDRVPLWRGDHVAIKQLVEDFGRFLYLPRLKEPAVLLGAIVDGLALLSWEQDGFACADSYDDGTGRYRGLRCMQRMYLADPDSSVLLVKPEVARRQMDAEKSAGQAGTELTTRATGGTSDRGAPDLGAGAGSTPSAPAEPPKPTRFHGNVTLDPNRVGRDASRIADEVISHLAALIGSTVKVNLEVEAEIPGGTPDNVVRTVTENCRTLKFRSQEFEKE